VEVLTDRPEDRFRPGGRLYREGQEAPLTIATAQADEPGWLIRFDEVPDRTSAEALRESYLEAVVQPGEELARGEYYWHEVIGTEVRGVEGLLLGTVEDVYRIGGAEVLLVRGETFGEFDVPLVRAFVRVFAPARGEIVVDEAALELQPKKPRRPRGRRSSRLARAIPESSSPAPADESPSAPDGSAAREPAATPDPG